MGFLDGFIAGQIYNSTSNNNDRRDESSELKRGLLNEKLARQNAEASKRDAERSSKLLLDSSKSTIDSLREDYNCMRKARDKFRNALSLEIEEKKALLSKPLYEAVKENENWDLAYDSLTSKLATSHVFKEAYKNLAIQYGEEKGLNADTVTSLAKNKAINTLEKRREEIDDLNSDPTKSDNWYMCQEILPKERIERIIEKVKKL